LKGGYCLILSLDSKASLGAKGRAFVLAPGTYVYCGSALNSLNARMERHIRNFSGGQIKRFWHIDYLLPRSKRLTIVKAATNSNIECNMVSILTNKGLKPIHGFGNSDCRSECGGHLLLSEDSFTSTVRLVLTTFAELDLISDISVV